MALGERNAFEAYRAGRLEALVDLVRYCILRLRLVPSATHGSSALTTAAMNSARSGPHLLD